MITLSIILAASTVHASKCEGVYEFGGLKDRISLQCTVTEQKLSRAIDPPSGDVTVKLNNMRFHSCKLSLVHSDGVDSAIFVTCPSQD